MKCHYAFLVNYSSQSYIIEFLNGIRISRLKTKYAMIKNIKFSELKELLKIKDHDVLGLRVDADLKDLIEYLFPETNTGKKS